MKSPDEPAALQSGPASQDGSTAMTDNGAWSESTRDRIAAALVEHAPAGPQTEAHLEAIITSLATQPGKLVRGRLVLATTDAHGVDERVGLTLAAAVEYFHIASLLLDDLPCMDDAQIRRGQPCAHRVHGEASAILAALAFINRGYSLAGFALAEQPLQVRLQAQACLDASLGTAGLVGGQARDLRFAAGDRSVREVSRVAMTKTGAMMWLGLVLPALLAAPGRGEVRALEALCIYWGLAFQALDDLNDVLTTSVDAGKSTRRDRVLARPNLAVALGVPAARVRIMRLLRQAYRQVHRLVALRPAWAYLEGFHLYFVEMAVPHSAKPGEIAA
ncbi:MAG: polyprenyl synthetase family protein [Opitutus sp.]